MAQVRELLERKGSHVLTIGPAASVLQAALLMNEHRVGALVVVEGGRVVGMFTERDVLMRVVGERRDPEATRVGEVMTAAVVCCSPETTVDEARGVMRDRRIRHLPVADADGRLLGLISIGDLNAQILAAQEQTVFLLTEYIQGRV
ncbi:MAG TPA: CBS domain-containing protein [Gemmataceae bacterium]|jgi:CBS domain-containing protein|nr:CBS domain-containing protein [Gemmataceae bacterium]